MESITKSRTSLEETGKVKLHTTYKRPTSPQLNLDQGPKLTFLCGRQVETEIFFSVARWKILVAKSVRKTVASQQNTKLLKTFLRSEHNLTRERSQESDCHEKRH